MHESPLILGKLLTYTCAFVAKQYNLVLSKGWLCCVAGKVTVGLAESNSRLLLGFD